MGGKIIGKNSNFILKKLKISIIMLFTSALCVLCGSFSQSKSELGFYISWLILIVGGIGLVIGSIWFMISLYKALKFILTSLDILLEERK